MLASSAKILSDYGLAVFISLLSITALAWIFRIALKNPMEVVSEALNDIEMARKALREELAARDLLINVLRNKVAELEAEIDELRDSRR